MSLEFTTVAGERDLEQVLALQERNHRTSVDAATAASQGFTSVRHRPEVLRAMNVSHPSVIARDGPTLAGYCLVMPQAYRDQVPELVPMFALLDELSVDGRPLAGDPRWFVMGQVCVAQAFRGMGVFDGLYDHLRRTCQADYDRVLTEISHGNPRSLRAHRRVGFRTVHVHDDPDGGPPWEIVAWDWR
jgi:ribosomal protein S18 acetylase RimI-like enzyme